MCSVRGGAQGIQVIYLVSWKGGAQGIRVIYLVPWQGGAWDAG